MRCNVAPACSCSPCCPAAHTRRSTGLVHTLKGDGEMWRCRARTAAAGPTGCAVLGGAGSSAPSVKSAASLDLKCSTLLPGLRSNSPWSWLRISCTCLLHSLEWAANNMLSVGDHTCSRGKTGCWRCLRCLGMPPVGCQAARGAAAARMYCRSLCSAPCMHA